MSIRFSELVKELYEPKANDEKRFVAKHVIKKNIKSVAASDDNRFQATNIKKDETISPKKEYRRKVDAEVYEDTTASAAHVYPSVRPKTDSMRNRSLYSRERQVYKKHARPAIGEGLEEVLSSIKENVLNTIFKEEEILDTQEFNIQEAEHDAVKILIKKQQRILKSARDSGASQKRIDNLKAKHKKEKQDLHDRIEQDLHAWHKQRMTTENTDSHLTRVIKKSAKSHNPVHEIDTGTNEEFIKKDDNEPETFLKKNNKLSYNSQATEVDQDIQYDPNTNIKYVYDKVNKTRKYVKEDGELNVNSPGEAERLAKRYYEQSKTAGDPKQKSHFKYISNKMYALAKRLRHRVAESIDHEQGDQTQVFYFDNHNDAQDEALKKAHTNNDFYKVVKDPRTNMYAVVHKNEADHHGKHRLVGMAHPYGIYTRGHHESFEVFANSMISEELILEDGNTVSLDGELAVKILRLYENLNEENQQALIYNLHFDIDSFANVLDFIDTVE